MIYYQTLYLIDISSFIFRAFYAVRELTAPDGTPVNAVYGVASMLGRLMDEAKPSHLVVVYDSKEPSFRKELYPEYKANRSAAPDLLIPQFDLIEELIKHMGIPSYRQSGVEADDLIATLAKRWLENNPLNRVVVVSGDKDLMALVSSKVQVWDTMKDKHYTPHEVIEKFGVNPDQVRDFLAIVGDASDNIPGITGIGPKGAELLLREFGTLDGIIAAAKAGKIKGKKSTSIIEGEKLALLGVALASVAAIIPSLALCVLGFDSEIHVIKEFSEEIELENLISGILSIPPGGFTNIELGLNAAHAHVQKSKYKRARVILISDGRFTEGKHPAQAARHFHFLYPVKIGKDPSGREVMREIAATGLGRMSEVREMSQLPRFLFNAIRTWVK